MTSEELTALDGVFITSEVLWDDKLDCEKTQGVKCVSIEEFMDYCKAANGITQATLNSFKYPYAFPSQDVVYLLNNGGYKGYDIETTQEKFRVDKKTRPLCKIRIRVAGLYNGSQVDQEIESYITSFVIDKGFVKTYRARINSPYHIQ